MSTWLRNELMLSKRDTMGLCNLFFTQDVKNAINNKKIYLSMHLSICNNEIIIVIYWNINNNTTSKQITGIHLQCKCIGLEATC